MGSLFPADGPKRAWTVVPMGGDGKRLGDPVYVRAADEAGAKAAGLEWLRHLGFARKCQLIVYPYDPLKDPVMRGFVRAIPKEESV